MGGDGENRHRPLLFKKQQKEINLKVKKTVKVILSVVFLSIMGISIFNIVKIQLEDKKQEDFNEKLVNEAVVLMPEVSKEESIGHEPLPEKERMPISIDFEILKAQNDDVIAWVYCKDTPINYPIVKGEDNAQYLYRLLDGSNNSSGTLFADFRGSGDFSDLNTVIYGHNMKNNSMFGILPEYRKQDYYEKHPVWYLATPQKNYMVELVSGYVTPSDDSLYNVESNEVEQLQSAIKNSKFSSNVEILDTDRFITFSTCSYEYESARFVLLGVLREIKD